MKPEDVLTAELAQKLRALAEIIDYHAQKGTLLSIDSRGWRVPLRWVCVIWPYGQIDRANKIHNCDKKEAIDAMHNCAYRMEESDIIKPVRLP